MDNRRVIRSYREKQAASKSNTPYSRPTNGLFSKMKQFLTPASLWKTTGEQPKKDTNEQTKQLQSSQPDISTSLLPFKFVQPEFKTPHKQPSSSSNEVSSTPNHVLTSFFQSKGDRPLTEVEYEGVVALLSKSRQATPATAKRQRLSLPKGQTPSQSILDSPSHHLGEVNAETSIDIANSSNIFATPYSQRVLKNDSTSFSTPEYKPVYHTVNDNSFNRGLKGVPSVKRVYQFSGLPSPYRTRIKTPNLSSRKKKVDILTQPLQPSQIANTFNQTSASDVSMTNKPLSNTANTILSILDGGESIQDVNESNIKAFSSPFTRPKRGNKQADATEKKKLTAEDISRTILFDQSEMLPEIKFNQKKVSIEVENKSEPKAPKADPKPTFSFGITPVTASATAKPSTLKSNGAATTKTEVPQEKTSFNQSDKIAPAPTSTPSLFGNSKEPAVAPLVNGSTAAKMTSTFSFGAANKPLADTNPIEKSTLPKPSKPAATFTFPEIHQTHVQLDQAKVESYKPMFKF